MQRIVPIIVGPTAVGKTALSLYLAELLPIEVISADSRQIYRYMDIGTAKPSRDVLQKIPHHFIDICDPDEYYSAGRFGQEARKIIDHLLRQGKQPVVVGGSGFYIRALVDGIFEIEARDENVRRQLNERLAGEGLASLYAELQSVDPQYAQKISPTDKQRILRSLEVYLVTGKPFSYWHTQKTTPVPFPVRFWGLNSERSQLYARINKRVDAILQAGLEAEVKRLLEMGYFPDLNALNTVGYKEVISYLQGKISWEEMIEQIKRNSRRYAKRQLTWFRADKRIVWHQVEREEDLKQLAKQIMAEISGGE